MVELAEVVYENIKRKYRIGWYDPEQTIVVLQVLDRWTWDDAIHGVAHALNPIITAKAPQPVYSIIVHEHYGHFVPRGGNPLGVIRYLLQTDPPNDVLSLYVRQSDIIHSLLNVLLRVHKLTNRAFKYRHVETFEQALAAIAAHKAQAVRK
ncbi:MAG: hypothetical protein RML95_03980 [Anaerolineae bacterium]|nr:hypothetical protein [Anaerolineae bacterium]